MYRVQPLIYRVQFFIRIECEILFIDDQYLEWLGFSFVDHRTLFFYFIDLEFVTLKYFFTYFDYISFLSTLGQRRVNSSLVCIVCVYDIEDDNDVTCIIDLSKKIQLIGISITVTLKLRKESLVFCSEAHKFGSRDNLLNKVTHLTCEPSNLFQGNNKLCRLVFNIKFLGQQYIDKNLMSS